MCMNAYLAFFWWGLLWPIYLQTVTRCLSDSFQEVTVLSQVMASNDCTCGCGGSGCKSGSCSVPTLNNYQKLRWQLDELGYQLVLPIEAVPLVSRLVGDLLHTTSSLGRYKEAAQNAEQVSSFMIAVCLLWGLIYVSIKWSNKICIARELMFSLAKLSSAYL